MNLKSNRAETREEGLSKADEKDLLVKIKKRDREAFIKSYDLYVDRLYRFIYFKVGNEEEARDLTSTVFLKVWNYIQNDNLEDLKTLKALIYKIARNAVIDHYRRSKGNITSVRDGGENKIEISDESQDLARQAEIAFDFKIVESKLRELKDEYREIIILRFVDEMSIKEIAAVVDKPKNNVRVLIHRALKILKKLMEEEGHER